jgi:hypothetical protein
VLVSGRASGRKKQRHVSIADEKNRPTQQMLDIHRKDVKWTFFFFFFFFFFFNIVLIG